MDAKEEAKAFKSPVTARAAVIDRLDRGAVGEAEALLSASLVRWPDNPKLRLLRGEVAERLAQRGAAAISYAALLADDHVSAWAVPRLMALLKGELMPIIDVQIVVRSICNSGLDPKLMAQMLDRLLERNDATERAGLVEIAGTLSNIFKYESKLAVARIEAGVFDSALQILERARAAGRATVQGEVLAAELMRLFERTPEAVAVLDALVTRHPDQPELHRRLVMTLQRAGDCARAADALEVAVRRWPHDWLLAYRFNRLPVAPHRFSEIFAVMARDAEDALTANDRFRFQFALAALNTGEIARGVELLERKFEEPVSTLSTPVRKALRRRPPDGWLDGARLSDDRTKEVQVTRSAGARATVVLTTGIVFGYLPLAFIDSLFAAHGLNVVYLRDFQERAYLRGIATLGSDEAATITELKTIAAKLAAERLIVMGSSSGGFSALRYGALMEADTAVSFSGPTSALSFFGDTRASAWNPNYFVKALLERETDLPLDLVPMLSRSWPTKFLQLFGRDSAQDAAQALRLEGLPGVELRAVPDVADHFLIDHMIGDGSFDSLLEELASA